VTESEKKYLKQIETRLTIYEQAINRIDDHFEYRHESEKDKNFVRRTLAMLTSQLKSAFHK